MHINWHLITNILISFITGGVGGALFGAYAAHVLAKRRDAENRRQLNILSRREQRLKFINEVVGPWRTKMVLPYVKFLDIANQYRDDARIFGAYNGIETLMDEPWRTEFHDLCDKIVQMTPGEVAEKEGYAKLTRRLEGVIRILQEHP